MKRLIALALFAALLVPLFAVPMPTRVAAQDAGRMTGPQSSLPLGFDDRRSPPFDLLEQARRPAEQNQVRIQRRVIVRVSPAPPRPRTQMMADLSGNREERGFEEIEYEDCVDVADIASVYPTNDNRLLLFTRERHVLAVTLEESCVARAFYAGFYVERSDDGRLCVNRDLLQSRAGASCEVAEFSRLVAVGE